MYEYLYYGIGSALLLIILIGAYLAGPSQHHVDHEEHCACPDCSRLYYLRLNKPRK